MNDYVGPTDIREGTLEVGTGGTFGNLGSGPVTNNATLILNRSDTLTFTNTLFGSGSIVKSNANVLILPTANAGYNGTITAIGERSGPLCERSGQCRRRDRDRSRRDTRCGNAINLDSEPGIRGWCRGKRRHH